MQSHAGPCRAFEKLGDSRSHIDSCNLARSHDRIFSFLGRFQNACEREHTFDCGSYRSRASEDFRCVNWTYMWSVWLHSHGTKLSQQSILIVSRPCEFSITIQLQTYLATLRFSSISGHQTFLIILWPFSTGYSPWFKPICYSNSVADRLSIVFPFIWMQAH